MTQVYRLARKAFAANPLDGEGSYRYGGRWSSPGTRLVYTAEHLSLAMLEYLAHLDPGNWPDDLMLAVAEIPDALPRLEVQVGDLPADWSRFPAPAELGRVGDEFIASASAAILTIPSVLAPTEKNWLLNPAHPDFVAIKTVSIERFQLDRRLL